LALTHIVDLPGPLVLLTLVGEGIVDLRVRPLTPDEGNAVCFGFAVTEAVGDQTTAAGDVQPHAHQAFARLVPAEVNHRLVGRITVFIALAGDFVKVQIVPAEHPGSGEIVGDFLAGNGASHNPAASEMIQQRATLRQCLRHGCRRKQQCHE